MVIITDEEMHRINNKLAIIVGNIDIGERKGSFQANVLKASKELQETFGEILERNLEIRKLLGLDN